jgi:sigma-B regulation protein RsbU (phosphoserine phosphatase)
MQQETPVMPESQTEESRVEVLLVDDQAIVVAAVRKMREEAPDLRLHYCTDASKALDKAREVRPHVILQDLVMPGTDGLTLVKQYREDEELKLVPVVVLSSREEPKTKAASFAEGANDYLVKLPDPIEMIARLRHHARGYISLLERNAAWQALWKSQQLLAAELREAEEYVRALLPPPLTGEISTSWQYIPSTSLGGDAFGYNWLDPDHFAIYLLDVCGHGVGAALLSISAMNALRTRSLNADFMRPSSVLTALNDAYPMEDHDNKYFTLWYGVYDRSTGELTFASAGHPPAVLFTGDDPGCLSQHLLSTPNFAIGWIPGAEFEEGVQAVGAYAKLFVFSDGVYEFDMPEKGELSCLDFANALLDHQDMAVNDAERILIHMREMKGTPGPFEDDFSLVEVHLRRAS